jgi:hypothetical protein
MRFRAKTPSLVSLQAERDRGEGAIGPEARASAKRAGLADQAQDRGVEAVRPGPGRDEDDQHERIQDIGEIEPIVDPVRSIDRLVSFDSHSPRGDASDEDDHKQAERGEGRKEADEEGAAGGEFDRWHPPLVNPNRRNVQGC